MPSRRLSSRALALTLLLPMLVGAPAGAEDSPAHGDPPLEALDVGPPVDLPTGVTLQSGQANGLRLIADEEWVLANVRVDGRSQVGAIRLAGTGFSCVTCDVLDGGREASPFDDGRRVLVAGAASTMSDIQFHVVTCTPSLIDCRQRAAKPVTLPRDGLTSGVQNREPRLSPDGRHLTWTEVRATGGPVMVIGDLVETARDYRIAGPYVLNPAYSLTGGADALAPGTRYYETGGGWLDGGRTLVYRSTSTSMNYDIWELDLATGERRRVTQDADYNEIYEGGPDSARALYASARGLDRMDVFTQIERPAFLDVMSFPQLGRISLHNNRRCMNEHWLMDRTGQQGEYAGQPVVLQDGWVIRGSDWFDDGRRFIVTQQEFSADAGGQDDNGVEMRIVTIEQAVPTTPDEAVDLDTVDYQSWAIPYSRYVPLASRLLTSRRVEGAHSGTATLTYLGTFAAGRWAVRYQNYSDDGRSFLDGTESLTTLAAPVQATWQADLTSRGEHTGSMEGDLLITYPARFRGSVRTELDGQVWSGVPTQDTSCPGVRRPRLSADEVDTSTPGSVRVRVVSTVPESSAPQPVRGATVTAGDIAATTDSTGWAVVPTPASGDLRLTAGGFADGQVSLP